MRPALWLGLANVAVFLMLGYLLLAEADAGLRGYRDISIAFVVGGQSEHNYSQAVYLGAVDAADALGCRVNFRWTRWDLDRTLGMLRNSVAETPDGIAMIGQPVQAEYPPLLDEARRSGTVIMVYSGPMEAYEAASGHNGFGYAGQHVYEAGRALGRQSVRKFRLTPGSRALVVGLFSLPDRGRRSDGVAESLEEAGLIVDCIDMYAAWNGEPPHFLEELLPAYLAEHPEVALIVSDAGEISYPAAILEACEVPAERIRLAGFDVREDDLYLLLSGRGGLLLPQQPYLQGFLSVMHVCLMKAYGVPGVHVDTSAPFIDETNADRFLERAAKGMQ